MIFFLTTQPIWVSGAIIVGLGTLLSVLGTVLVRRYANVKRLTPDTEIAGFKFGTIGVLYAVLLAFAIIVVWEKYSDAELDVVQEAGAAENIYRLSQGLSDTARVAVLRSVANYLKTAINVDWPTMDQGITGTRAARGATKQALDAVYAALVVPRASIWVRSGFLLRLRTTRLQVRLAQGPLECRAKQECGMALCLRHCLAVLERAEQRGSTPASAARAALRPNRWTALEGRRGRSPDSAISRVA
jgi:Protein of unknown function (DUF4239)